MTPKDREFVDDPGRVPDHKFGMFSDTSKQAYERSRPSAKALRDRIMNFKSWLKNGATSDELAEIMGVTMEEVARRMPELEKAGKVYKTGQRRLTRKGCSATVWKLVEDE